MDRTVESWKTLLAGWLAVANMQLYHWWLQAAEDVSQRWRIGAAVRVPFGEGDKAMLRWAMEAHLAKADFERQEGCFRFLHVNRSTRPDCRR